MTLILHIAKKDLHQTWPWILAVLLSLAGLGWVGYMVFHAPPPDRNLWANALTGAGVATAVSAAVFLAMLVHSESLCGTRAHWLGRPVDWRHLLAAKSLLGLAVLALPLLLFMTVFLAAEGFSPWNHLPAIFWRATVTLIVFVLPVAALATVTSNLQQMALWLVGLFLAAMLAASAVHARGGGPLEVLWLADAASYLLIALLGTAIAVWQYANRGARTARVLLAAGVPLFLLVQGMSPRAALFAAQRRLSPVAAQPEKGTLLLDAPRPFPPAASLATNWGRHIFLPVRVAGLGPNELTTLDAVDHFELNAAGERMQPPGFSLPALRRAGAGDNYWLQIPIDPAFLQRHRNHPASLKLNGQMTLYGNRRAYPVTNALTDIPGVGRCRAESAQVFQVRCTAPFRITSLLELFLLGADRDRALALQVLAGDRAPLDLQFHPFPVTRFHGYIPASHELLPTEHLEIAVAEPHSYVERELNLTGLRLEDYRK